MSRPAACDGSPLHQSRSACPRLSGRAARSPAHPPSGQLTCQAPRVPCRSLGLGSIPARGSFHAGFNGHFLSAAAAFSEVQGLGSFHHPSSVIASSASSSNVASTSTPPLPNTAGNGASTAGGHQPSKSSSHQQPQPGSPTASASPSSSSTPKDGSVSPQGISASSTGFQLKPIHGVMFALIFFGGALIATMTLQFTFGMEFWVAVNTVLRKVSKSVAFRQLVVIACAILVVRFGMNTLLKTLAKFSSSPVQWDKTKLYYVLREVYQPLELLLFIAALCTVADSFVPSLISLPKATVSHMVKSILSTSFILGFSSVVFNLKSRFCKENAWQAEMKGDVTTQRRWEAYDKLGTFIIYAMTFTLGIQSIGLEVTSVLAIGGIGGLAIGLAGREICENLLNGFLIMSTSPFEVGDEVHFFHSNKQVEGLVIDIGWYRTLIRSYEREVFIIPNAVFSKNIVLNISRKNREWRFNEVISVRVQDVQKANAIIQDIRRIVRNDNRIINKLHRRIFLDKISHEDCKIYVSFYLEANNRDAFMAIKQDLLLAFVDCVERNGAKLATPRTVVDMDPEVADALTGLRFNSTVFAAAHQAMNQQSQAQHPAKVLLPEPQHGTITAEATPVNTGMSSSTGSSDVAAGSSGGTGSSSSSSSAAAANGSHAPVYGAVGPINVGVVANGSQHPGGASSTSSSSSSGSGSSSGSSNQLGAVKPSSGSSPSSSPSVSPRNHDSSSGSGGSSSGTGGSSSSSSSGGGGVPVSFAGGVSNNVVGAAGMAAVPVKPKGGSSSGHSPRHDNNGLASWILQKLATALFSDG